MNEKTQDTLMQGIAAGFFGFLTTAIVFAVANVFAGRSPFYTPAVLGATMFYGVTDPAQMEQAIAPYVFAYNGTHLLAFIAFGLIGSWLASVAERGKMLWYPALFFMIFVAFHFIGGIQLAAQPIRETVQDGAVWVSGVLAASVMVAYLLHEHPGVRQQLRGWQE
jgi:hypothetical protein